MNTTKRRTIVALAAAGSALAIGYGIGLTMAPDAGAHPGHGHCEPTESQQNHPCDPLTFILGEPPVPASDATEWQDLLMPPEAGPRPVLGARIGEAQ
jgi:hypothetical protein